MSQGKHSKNADVFGEDLPCIQEYIIDEKSGEGTTQINHQTESQPFSEVYSPKVFARRTSFKRDTPLGMQRQASTRNQQTAMETDEDPDERLPCTLVREGDKK